MPGWWILLFAFLPQPSSAETRLIDGFEDKSLWSLDCSDGVKAWLGSDQVAAVKGRALCLTYEFKNDGTLILHRNVNVYLPENYAFSFCVRGGLGLDFKLIDSSGENVWSYVGESKLASDGHWKTVTIKKRQIQFASGPQGGGNITHVAAIELSISPRDIIWGGPENSSYVGTVSLDELELRPLPVPNPVPPKPTARASSGKGQSLVLDGNVRTGWRPSTRDKNPWIELDLREPREYCGLVVDWEKNRAASNYIVEASMEGRSWNKLGEVKGGNGGRDYVYLPESESHFLRLVIPDREKPIWRFLRLVISRPAFGVRELTLLPITMPASKEDFFKAIAMDTPRGAYPRGIRGERSAWRSLGPKNNRSEGFLGGDGALVTRGGRGPFSIEPFLFRGGRLLTWADVDIERSWEQGHLPSVTWKTPDLNLTITAFADPPESFHRDDSWGLLSRYQVENTSSEPVNVLLFLAIRPFQVNPPSHGIDTPDGCSRIWTLEYSSGTVSSRFGDVHLLSLVPPSGFGAISFDGGDLVGDYLSRGLVPPATRFKDPFDMDPFEAASGALAYRLKLSPHEHAAVELVRSNSGKHGCSVYGWDLPRAVSFDAEMGRISKLALQTMTYSLPGKTRN